MSRKNAREIALHLIFEMGFEANTLDETIADRLSQEMKTSIGKELSLYAENLDENDKKYITETVKGVFWKQQELDGIITEHSKAWSFSRLSRMTVAILRLALYEMQNVEDVPVGVAINEAVELAKSYDSAESSAFINGILGTVNRKQEQVPQE